MQRIVILGTSGSGKTTLAGDLARRQGVSHIELDALNWKSNWTPTPREEMRAAALPLLEQAGWTIDGNYKSLRDMIWLRADTLIWLDYSMTITFSRVLRRTLARSIAGTELWNGNRERLAMQFCSRDSILLWVINQWRKNRRDYPALLREQHARGKRVLRFRTPAQTRRWLATITPRPATHEVA